jgi:hypothetical protein
MKVLQFIQNYLKTILRFIVSTWDVKNFKFFFILYLKTDILRPSRDWEILHCIKLTQHKMH